MSDMCWSPKEQTALAQFKERLSDLDLSNELFEDRQLIRWILAREFRLDDAEIMLRKHLAWRKENNIDNILECNTPTFQAAKTLPCNVLGVDNNNNVILGAYAAPIDFTKMLYHFGKKGTLEIFYVVLETTRSAVVASSKGSSRMKQVVYIEDLEGIRIKDYFSTEIMDLFIAMLKCIDANYPEMLCKAYIINAPSLFTSMWNMIKPILSPRTIEKIEILGHNQDKMRSCLFENISKSQLAPKWGGTYCSPFAPHLNISMITGLKEENLHKFKQTSISGGDLFDVVFNIENLNTILRWKFQTENYDIGFVLLYKPNFVINFPTPDSSSYIVSSEISSYKRLNSHKNIQIGKLVCSTPGEYRLRFDNTYSRYRAKTLHYQISTAQERMTNM